MHDFHDAFPCSSTAGANGGTPYPGQANDTAAGSGEGGGDGSGTTAAIVVVVLLCVGAAVGASVWYYGKRKASASFSIAASRASVRLKNVNRNPAFAKDSAYAPANDGGVEKETTPAPGDDLFSDDGGRAAVSNATYEHGPAPIRGASLRRVQGVKANPSYMDMPAADAAAADDDDVYQNGTTATDTGAQSPGGVDDDVYQNGAVDGQHAASPNVDHAGHGISTAAPPSSAAAGVSTGLAELGGGYAVMHPPLGAGGPRDEHDHDHPDADKYVDLAAWHAASASVRL